jgi:hypothetical protein
MMRYNFIVYSGILSAMDSWRKSPWTARDTLRRGPWQFGWHAQNELMNGIGPVESKKTSATKLLEKPRGISLVERHDKALAGLNDGTEPLPRVW